MSDALLPNVTPWKARSSQIKIWHTPIGGETCRRYEAGPSGLYRTRWIQSNIEIHLNSVQHGICRLIIKRSLLCHSSATPLRLLVPITARSNIIRCCKRLPLIVPHIALLLVIIWNALVRKCLCVIQYLKATSTL